MRTKFNSAIFLFLIFFSIVEKVIAQSPDWMWAKANGCSASCNDIATDINGNVLITGSFDQGGGVFDTINVPDFGGPGSNLFIAKYSASGNALWAQSAGSWGPCVNCGCGGVCATTDVNGNVIIGGTFYSPIVTSYFAGNFLFNADSSGTSNTSDFFVIKFDASGNYLWSISGGGMDDDYCSGVATDSNGNILITGYFGSSSITLGTTTLTNAGTVPSQDIFIAKYDPAGNLLWAQSAGGNGWEEGRSIATDGNGNIVISGDFESDTITFDTILLSNLSIGQVNDIFITKYSSSGNVLWAKRAGGLYGEGTNGMASDINGNVLLTGTFSNTTTFGSTVLTAPTNGLQDIFIAKYDTAGNVLWAKSAGGSYTDIARSIAVDTNGNSLLTGHFTSPTMSFDSITLNNLGSRNTFISKYGSSGNLIWAKSLGCSNDVEGLGISADVTGNAYVCGYFHDSTITFGSTTFTNTCPYSIAYFWYFAKLGECASYFTLHADTIPHNWIGVNLASGVAPLSYLWNWGDGNTSIGATPSHIYAAPGYYNVCLTITDAIGCTSTYCDSSMYIYRGNADNTIITINVVLPGTTNIPEQTTDKNIIIIYPNPSTGNFAITFPEIINKGSIRIYNVLGENVFVETTFNESKKEFDLKNISDGIYFVKVFDGEKSYCKKLIIERD